MVELAAAAITLALVQMEDAARRRRRSGGREAAGAGALFADLRDEEYFVKGGLECLEGIKMLVRGQHLGDDKGALESRGHSVEEGEILGLAGLPNDLEGAR